jgi:hypothetical protein
VGGGFVSEVVQGPVQGGDVVAGCLPQGAPERVIQAYLGGGVGVEEVRLEQHEGAGDGMQVAEALHLPGRTHSQALSVTA